MNNISFHQEVLFVKGIGPNKAKLLDNELQIKTVHDLLYDLPMRYVDRRYFHPIKNIRQDGNLVQIKGKITKKALVGKPRNKRLVARIEDDEGQSIDLVWFKGVSWIQEHLIIGPTYIAFGKVSKYGRQYNIAHPEMKLYKPENLSQSLEPVYRSTEALNKNYLDGSARKKTIRLVLDQLAWHTVEEFIPEYIMKKTSLIPRSDALKWIHFPKDYEQLESAKHRLKFEELFIAQIKICKHYVTNKKEHKGYVFEKIGEMFHDFYDNNLSFELTNAQKRVLKEIRRDLKSGIQMNRLLQGDVGSGKTIVAIMSMLMAADNGFQSCLMAPTEILTQQHFESIKNMLTGLPLRVGLLTGSVKGKERKQLLKLLQLGELHLLVGTHALIQAHVQFRNLGLAIIDEQHRFGVAQRAMIWEKGKSFPPHILVMTATPIPRTLHMTVYGDLDVSVIDELPPGRKPVVTLHKTEYHRPEVIKLMKRLIADGNQIYVVYPLIEESEKLNLEDLNNGYEFLLTQFPRPDYQISVVHGRMKPDEKDFEMNRFIENKTQIMVATTVIEVGVNVPNATAMIIENSERFGLSQLHQLRGRVGRGADQSYCVLMTSFKLSEDGKKRIQTMVRTNNGFEIAEADLQLRGPGMIEGTQQSGLPQFKIANIIDDQKLLKTAREIALRILESDTYLERQHHQSLKKYLLQYHSKDYTWSQIS